MTALLFVGRYWKLILGGLGALAFTIALIAAKADARHWHKQADQYAAQIAQERAQAAIATAQAATRAQQAADAYAARTAALQPLIVHSTDTVTRYAQTPAGRASCLDADRVRGLDDLDAALSATRSTPSGAGAVPADTPTPH